jgi:heme/copper-type cytochrome/quinol oxidase subunit 3
MADAATISTSDLAHAGSKDRPQVQAPPLTPGKVAIWLFLATEVMFFTGLIGTYIVLRAGSAPAAYSNFFPPATDLSIVLKQKPEGLVTISWPKPFDPSMNPLSVELTTANTFILMASSLTLVLALSACRRSQKRKTVLFLTLTAVFGTVFLAIQAHEYNQLLFVHHYPEGVSASGHRM